MYFREGDLSDQWPCARCSTKKSVRRLVASNCIQAVRAVNIAYNFFMFIQVT